MSFKTNNNSFQVLSSTGKCKFKHSVRDSRVASNDRFRSFDRDSHDEASSSRNRAQLEPLRNSTAEGTKFPSLSQGSLHGANSQPSQRSVVYIKSINMEHQQQIGRPIPDSLDKSNTCDLTSKEGVATLRLEEPPAIRNRMSLKRRRALWNKT